ncbi:MAG: CRISPR-associated protein Csx19 [Candidatus Cloacimonadaceae bacterium]|jgi:CRISPR-associated protein (TIGR03984 family)|nr:CRISPR-associated protein Csx19 [Candidatus Cloacimonadota bacterium]MDY0128551.1 CRISPR-associated protein Csx19 [Candidatus Cloacimonadaceae bacterium]MCB5255855.1 CRISPR-associated protein Csx19 [Candidatus Cloacimonadota bacterium]MCK9242075.1 CRISPR-associated protein Csx19 [Candidatus Cloacimonadota bacterium]MDD3102726.1 CRISPR-associated protein Csx19 [Candidatus Cloacimonadota bacterium]
MNKIKQINTTIESIDSITSIGDIVALLDEHKEYQVLAYLIPAIAFGTYRNGFKLSVETLDFCEIESIRIFCPEGELFCYRYTDSETGKASQDLRGRFRKDEEGEVAYYHDAAQILTGKRIVETSDSYSLIAEDRGFQLLLPECWIKQDPAQSRLRVLTRNYLAEWDNGQLSYGDHRFVAIGHIDEEI